MTTTAARLAATAPEAADLAAAIIGTAACGPTCGAIAALLALVTPRRVAHATTGQRARLACHLANA